jgi:hypothetical protein
MLKLQLFIIELLTEYMDNSEAVELTGDILRSSQNESVIRFNIMDVLVDYVSEEEALGLVDNVFLAAKNGQMVVAIAA